MNLVLLRQGCPRKSKNYRVYQGSIEEHDDIYALLWERTCSILGAFGEIWWVGWGEFCNQLTPTLVERGVSLSPNPYFDTPSLFLARGHYPYYRSIFSKFQDSYKVYYRAGSKLLANNRDGYDGILVDDDDEEDAVVIKRIFPKSKVDTLIKSAPENIFFPYSIEKRFDVVIISSNIGQHKGLEWASKNIPTDLSILRIGRKDPWFKHSNHRTTYSGWIPRKQIPYWACQAKICAITSEPKGDSNPRVASECLAMDIPLIVRSGFPFARRYLSHKSAWRCSDDNFGKTLSFAVNQYEQFRPREHYQKYLSLDVAANQLAQLLSQVMESSCV